MTVRTADLALTDLWSIVARLQPYHAELCHRCALGPDVVELEHNGVSLSAIDARVRAGHQGRERGSGRRSDSRRAAETRRRDAPPPARWRSYGDGSCADDLAYRDLGVDGLHRAVRKTSSRRSRSSRRVIELEDHRIGFAAIDARVNEDGRAPCAQGSLSSQLGGVDCDGVRRLARGSTRRSKTGTTTAARRVTVEAFDGELVPQRPQRRSWPRLPHAQALVGMASRGRCGGSARVGSSPRTHTLTEDFATPSSRAMRASDHPISVRSRRASLRA